MSRTQTWTNKLLIGATVAATSLALSACCKSNTEETTVEETPVEEPVVAEEPAVVAEPASTDPEWKQKCPDADRAESGTVTVLQTLKIYKEPNTDSQKESTISPGTWVNLLGAKSTWYCIDYPCGVGKLCPGWIEARHSKRKETTVVQEDAGTKVAEETKDAAAPVADASVIKDAEAPKTDASRFRLPKINIQEAGTKTSTPPGLRPPAKKPE